MCEKPVSMACSTYVVIFGFMVEVEWRLRHKNFRKDNESTSYFRVAPVPNAMAGIYAPIVSYTLHDGSSETDLIAIIQLQKSEWHGVGAIVGSRR